ncbi:hypothetical protein QVD17_37062 [Tagetes erecta]|uniref:Uncharacterized protein n=1 Tax=Tagetes erecta TaxID=13708 RepID=A0AAD8JTD7_TARER|nr:hypothetical protein QVD17_37062 [Tagetes erecta]
MSCCILQIFSSHVSVQHFFNICDLISQCRSQFLNIRGHKVLNHELHEVDEHTASDEASLSHLIRNFHLKSPYVCFENLSSECLY